MEESAYQFWSKNDKNGQTYDGATTGVDLQTIFSTGAESRSSVIFLHTISRAAAQGQDNEFVDLYFTYIFIRFFCKSVFLLCI